MLRVSIASGLVLQQTLSMNASSDLASCSGDVGQFRLSRDLTKCLDIAGQEPVDGARLFLEFCDSQASQNFIWCSDGRIVSAKNQSMCLDIPGDDVTKPNNLQMWQCNSKAGQYWEYDNKDMAVFPANAGETMCMDLVGASTKTGTLVNSYFCSPGKGEQWYAGNGPPPAPTPAPSPTCVGKPGYFQLNKDPTKCMDIVGGSPAKGAQMQIWGCNGQDHQKFIWCSDNRIVSATDHEMCLDVPGGDPRQIANLQMWKCNGQDGQKWGYDNKTLSVFPSALGEEMCMDLNKGAVTPGTLVNIFTCKPGSGEQWLTNPVGFLIV